MTPLDELATRCGVAPAFRDAHGQIRHTPASTQRALLAAMDVPAEDDTAATAALHGLDRAEWARVLPPVCVLHRRPEPFCVDVTLPAGTGAVGWTVSLEDGGTLHGEAGFDTMELRDRHTLDGVTFERRRIVLGDGLPDGYHSLAVTPGLSEMVLIVTPGRCWLPPSVERGQRLWGVAAQLYLLRSATDWGIGDYGDLRRLVEILARRGADIVGLNPLHAMFLDDPEHASPYSPASRLLLNVLCIDVTAATRMVDSAPARALIASDTFQARLAACRDTALVDYTGVAALKMAALDLLFEASRAAPDTAAWQEFVAFRAASGPVLEQGCLFQALRQHFAAGPDGKDQNARDWRSWPAEYRAPHSPAVARFAREQAVQISFHAWLQWLADRQLAEAAAAAVGMEVGLYRDLAVGADASSVETWANQTAVVNQAQVGAPPDIHNPAGQNWGLPPFHPRALHSEAYRSFIDLVRANMRHAGGLRIDHVMALQRAYWVPQGRPASEGGYVNYPMEDLVGILALESQRNRCLVIGEDLGTVPEGFRERMAEAGILSYRVLFFEKHDTGFLSADTYPTQALAVLGSHDLPTLRGWWAGGDIALKEGLHLYPTPADADQARSDREIDRVQLVTALREGGFAADAAMDNDQLGMMAHAFLATTPSMLAMIQIDDITDEAVQVNVPTTTAEHPNWRRKQSMILEDLAHSPRLDELAALFNARRGNGGNGVP